jgi:hypothetical protein
VVFDWGNLKNVFAQVLGVGTRETQDIEEGLNTYQRNQPIKIEFTQTETQVIGIGTTAIDTTTGTAVTTTTLAQLDVSTSEVQATKESNALSVAATHHQTLNEAQSATSEKEANHSLAPTNAQEKSEKHPLPLLKPDAAKLLSQFKPLRNNAHTPQKKTGAATQERAQEINIDSCDTSKPSDGATDQTKSASSETIEASVEVSSAYIAGADSVDTQTTQSQNVLNHSQTDHLSSVIKPVSPPIQADFSVLDKLLRKSSHPEALKDFLYYVQGEISQGRFNGNTYVLHFIEHLGQSCLFLVSPKVFQDYLRFNQAQLTERGITLKTLQNALTSLKMNHPHKEDGNIIRVVINPSNVRKNDSKTTYHAQMRGFLLHTTLTHQLVHPVPASNPYLMLGYEHLHQGDETQDEPPTSASKNAVKLTVVKPAPVENKPESAHTTAKKTKKESQRTKPTQTIDKMLDETDVSDDSLMLDESQIPEQAFY